jgi:hypothetical protein
MFVVDDEQSKKRRISGRDQQKVEGLTTRRRIAYEYWWTE